MDVRVKCPTCGAGVIGSPDETGVLMCACGARLRTAAPSPTTTLPPGTPLKQIPTPAEMLVARDGALSSLAAELKAQRASLDEVLRLQREMLDVLTSLGRRASPPTPLDDLLSGLEESPPRTRRRQKTTLVVDHDAEARGAAVAALAEANLPVRSVATGNEALAAIAEAKPDVVVMDLALEGSMGGKDLINAIRATMEWADVRIVLHTAVPVLSAHEARSTHGADEIVPKAAGSSRMLTHRIIQLFQEER